MAALPSSPPSFDNTLGALFIGFSVSTVIYGVLCVQVYNYCRLYPSDKVGYKVIVASLLVLETVHQALIAHTVYFYSITNFLNVLVVSEKPVWSLTLQLLLGAIVGFIVKFLFSLRVWRFSKGNVWLMSFLLLLNFGQLSLGIAFTAESFASFILPEPRELRVLGSVALGIGVLDDISVAAALCYYLRTMKSSYEQTNSLIRRLTLYAVNTGVLTSAMSFSTLLANNVMPRNFVFAGCYFVLSKLYAASFVATLNTRQTIRGRGIDSGAKRFSLATDRRPRSVNVPLHAAMITRDLQDVVSGIGEEHGAIPPDSGEDFVIPVDDEDCEK